MAWVTDSVDLVAELVRDDQGRVYRLVSRPCPVCGPAPYRVVGRRGGRAHRYGHGVETTIVRCRACGVLRPEPYPCPEDPGQLYGDPDKYFAAHDPARKVESNRLILRRLRDLAAATAPALLDVGSGRGEMLAAAAAEGIEDATGLELAPAMIDAAREQFGVRVLQATAEEHAEVTARRYDMATMASVLEHVADPDATVAALARLVRPGGAVYLELPREPNLMTHVGNMWHRLRGSDTVLNLSPTFAPFHVFGFDPRSLGRLLVKHGFEVRHVRVWAEPHIGATGGAADRTAALMATAVNHTANLVRMAANMEVWAQRVC